MHQSLASDLAVDLELEAEFQEMSKIMLASVAKALTPIANISIESQVLVNSNEWHLDTSVTAAGRSKVLQFVVYILSSIVTLSLVALLLYKFAKDSYYPYYVGEYVPSAIECPLLLQLPNGEISKTNGFISPVSYDTFVSPMWGGIVIWNPPQCTGDSQKKHLEGSTLPPQVKYSLEAASLAQMNASLGIYDASAGMP
ncbi:hypothetical protein BHM03_00001202 [Ensete ventricosum]|nr:hypothetical protein BHM03_00001202 [Ensete ventricosum]